VGDFDPATGGGVWGGHRGLEYPELGIRSFGKGTFHKEPIPGIGVGSKRLYEIRPGDLVFNNVFAWEGAVAVAQEGDAGRCGSHRFITCIAAAGVATSQFLCFYFLTDEGLERLRSASPGGAGRNRTLGLTALSQIEVPVPPFETQLWFDDLQRRVDALKSLQNESAKETDVLLRSILDKAPSAELAPGQLDTDSLPPYGELDPVLEAYVEERKSMRDMESEGFDPETVRRVVRMVDANEYKRRQAPPGVRVSPRAFGKDRRLPITNRWSG